MINQLICSLIVTIEDQLCTLQQVQRLGKDKQLL